MSVCPQVTRQRTGTPDCPMVEMDKTFLAGYTDFRRYVAVRKPHSLGLLRWATLWWTKGKLSYLLQDLAANARRVFKIARATTGGLVVTAGP